MKNEKRYIVTLDLYVYAENDNKAKKEAERYIQHIKEIDDNKAEVVSIHEAPFGALGELREVAR